MSDFEMDEKDFEADSWSLAVDSSFLQQHKKEVMKKQDVIYGMPRALWSPCPFLFNLPLLTWVFPPATYLLGHPYPILGFHIPSGYQLFPVHLLLSAVGFCFFFYFIFKIRVSSCRPGWSQTLCLPASAPGVVR